MDRLKLIEVITEELVAAQDEEDDEVPEDESEALAYIAGRLADAIIRSGALRSFQTGDDAQAAPEGGTMPPGPWSGHP
jgi:hypothetical protein